MDADSFTGGLLIAGLTLSSVGIFLIGVGTVQIAVTTQLVALLAVLGLGTFVAWRRGDYPWYVICGWTVPLVTALALMANAGNPPDQIRFIGSLFLLAGVVNLALGLVLPDQRD